MLLTKVVGFGYDGTLKLRTPGPLDRCGEMTVSLSIEQILSDFVYHSLDLAVGGGISAQYLVVQLPLEPQPAAILVDRGFVYPSCGTDLRRPCAEEIVYPSAGETKRNMSLRGSSAITTPLRRSSLVHTADFPSLE